MTQSKNPYAISFGRMPTQYICRDTIVDDITQCLEDDIPREQAFKLTGIRGTGKTVTLTEIERQIRSLDNWIVIGLQSNSDIVESLVAKLYDTVPYITSFVNTELNLSKFGIGLNISNKSPLCLLLSFWKLQRKNIMNGLNQESD